MKINNTNITTWSARQSAISFTPMKFTNPSVWKSGAAAPTIFPGVVGFKDLTVKLIVKGASRDAILKNVSGIVAACKDKVTLTLDKYSRQFTGYMVQATNEEMAKHQFHRLTLQFSGYEHGAAVTVTGTNSVTINNAGNIISPAKITLTPSVAIETVSLTGVCRDSYTGADLPVTVKSLVKNTAVILDGINGGITQGGNPREATIWRLPSLVPGSNTITCDNSFVTMSIQYLPLYA